MGFSIEEHLASRHVDMNLHTVYTSDTKATFMLYNLSGQIVGYQAYSPLAPNLSSNSLDGRYYTHRSRHIAIFGQETIPFARRTVFLTEGVFDIVRLTKLGCSGLALLTNSPNSSILNFLYCLPYKLILISDNDKGGEILRKRLTGIVSDIIIPPYKDLGEAEESYVKEIKDNCN